MRSEQLKEQCSNAASSSGCCLSLCSHHCSSAQLDTDNTSLPAVDESRRLVPVNMSEAENEGDNFSENNMKKPRDFRLFIGDVTVRDLEYGREEIETGSSVIMCALEALKVLFYSVKSIIAMSITLLKR